MQEMSIASRFASVVHWKYIVRLSLINSQMFKENKMQTKQIGQELTENWTKIIVSQLIAT